MTPNTEWNADDSESLPVATARPRPSEGTLAVRVFGMMAGLLAAASLMAVLLWNLAETALRGVESLVVPAAFAVSTGCLALCSIAQQRALFAVNRERQRMFRRALRWGLVFGTLFVGVQTFGLTCVVENLQSPRDAGEAQLGALSLVLGAAALHALHVGVALMFLVYVTLQAHHDRYDHEYAFGVAVCAWFWHILGILWVFILGTFVIVSTFLSLRVVQP